ncbi:MAG: ABC transporter substrate-binding protein, partial [Chloroflexota bacterium]
ADVPADLGPITPDDFRLARLRYVEPRPYPAGEFERTHQWMVGWGLASPDAAFAELVDNRIGVA